MNSERKIARSRDAGPTVATIFVRFWSICSTMGALRGSGGRLLRRLKRTISPVVSFRRDPLDRRYPERLTAGTVVSLIFHALLALLLFTVLVSSSQEGATESVSGGETVTIERRSPVQVAHAPAVAAAVPVPHVEQVAPVRHAPLSQPVHQRLPQNQHELAREQPSSPPNPKPIPQQSAQPEPQPTQNVFEPVPATSLPAAPVTVPTVAPIAVAIKAPATAAPSPAPTARATAPPSPKPPAPTAAPTAKPATPAPVAPSAAPTAAAVAVRASALPSASPAPATRASLPPAKTVGVPSPSATTATAVAKTAGAAPSPGPKSVGSPGPSAGAGQEKAAPARPIAIPPTPKPVPTRSPAPASSAAANLNDRLRSLLPNNPVNPTTKSYTSKLSLQGSMQPTPPPEVLAQTRYFYKSTGSSEGVVEMWVVSAHKSGPTTVCTGWLVRYPLNESAPHAGDFAPANGTQASVGGGRGAGLMPPIVEGMVTAPCEGRLLVPYGSSGAAPP